MHSRPNPSAAIDGVARTVTEDEPFTATTVFHALRQVDGNRNWRKARRRSQQALQKRVLRVYWAILGPFGLGARKFSGR